MAPRSEPASRRARRRGVGRRPAGVLFDAGGTLVRINRDRLVAALAVEGVTAGDLDGAFWRTLALLDTEFTPGAAYEQWFPRWLERFAAAVAVPTAVFDRAWRAADAPALLWDEPAPGAVACLTRLRDAGVRIGVVSNSDGRIGDALGRAGLAPLIDCVVDSGTVGVEKPDPAIFAHALHPLGLRAEHTWFLGDTVRYDAAGAEAAGLTAWVIDHGGTHTVPFPRRVTSLGAFADAVLEAR
jgi:putative hydrolase of the HAD superfamily